MPHECVNVLEGAHIIAAQLEDLRHDVAKQRRALETITAYLPSAIEAVRNLYELVRPLEELVEAVKELHTPQER